MKRKWSCFICVLILALVVPMIAMAAPAGKVTHIEGKVDITRTGIPAAKTLLPGESVNVGDTIRTKSKSKVEITFGNNNVLRIAASSRVVIQQYTVQGDNSTGVMKLARGMVQAISSAEFIKRLAASPEKNKLEVDTMNATCGIRGSNMIVSYYGGVTSVLFVTGRGYAYNPVKPGIIVPVTAGNITFIEKKDAPPTPPRPVSDVELNVKVKAVKPDEKSKLDQEQKHDVKTEEKKIQDEVKFIKDDKARFAGATVDFGDKKSDQDSSLKDKMKSGDIPGVGSVPTDPGGLPPGLAGTFSGKSDTAPDKRDSSPGKSDPSPDQRLKSTGLSSSSSGGMGGTSTALGGSSSGRSGTVGGTQTGNPTDYEKIWKSRKKRR